MARFAISLSISLLFSLSLNAQNQHDSLTTKTFSVQEVIVNGYNAQQENLLSSQLGTTRLTGELINKMPVLFGEPDVLKSLQLQSGVSAGVEGFAGLYVHGGGNDENLYMVDDLPLYHVTHLGGLFSSFNVSVIDHADFYKSSFPARYGGRASSVTDIRLKESNYKAFHGQYSLGLLSGNAYLTGPILRDKFAFTASLRKSWIDLLSRPALWIYNAIEKKKGKKTIANYDFADINLKLDYKLSATLKGFTTFYYGHDNLKVGDEHFPSDGSESWKNSNEMKLSWGNSGVSSGLSFMPTEKFLLYANGYITHYSSTFEQNRDEYRNDEDENYHDFSYKSNRNGVTDTGLSLTSHYAPAPWYSFQAGASLVHHNYRPVALSINDNSEEFSNTVLQRGERVSAEEQSLFIDNRIGASWPIETDLGLRAVRYSSLHSVHQFLEPRMSFRLLLNSNWSVKAGYTNAHQFVQQVCNSNINLPTDSWLPIGSQWQPLSNRQVSAGVYGNLPYDLYFSAEIYYKWMNNILEYKEGSNVFTAGDNWSDKLTSGRGYAYGMDLSVHRDVGRLTGNINYSLLWNRRHFADINQGETFPAKYDNRHKVNINVAYQLTPNTEFTAGWTYVTGNRLTLSLYNYRGLGSSGFKWNYAPVGAEQYSWSFSYYSSRNNYRMPATHRLDLGLNVHKHFRSGHERIWSFGLYNAYCHMNAVALTKGIGHMSYRDGQQSYNAKYSLLCLLPILPSVSYTFKF